MAVKVTKAGPRRIVFAPNAGQVNSAQPQRPHPIHPVGPITTRHQTGWPQPTKPKVGTSGPPSTTPVFPTPGHFAVNDLGNIVRISSPGQAPVSTRPYPRNFQAMRTPGGNPVVNYVPSVGVAQDTPTIKIAGSSNLAMTALPGNPKRRNAQPVSTVAPFSRQVQNGGQAYLPSYKRKKMGRAG